MWLALLALCFVAAAIHLYFGHARSRAAAAELFLVYLLAGYCGAVQIIRSIVVLVTGAPVMSHVQVTPGDPGVLWLAFFGLGCGAIGFLTIWKRGDFLLAPVVAWSIFWVGTTFAHTRMDQWHGLSSSWFILAWTFATHGFIALALVSLYTLSRRQPSLAAA
ncbi:MAG: DUF6790 family protein [Lysobacter sp.]